MCDTLSELRAAMRRYAVGFDAKVLSADQAQRRWSAPALVGGRGKRAFVAPGDPRQPGRAHAHDPPSAA